MSDYNHTCPYCGHKAYHGYLKVQCTNYLCSAALGNKMECTAAILPQVAPKIREVVKKTVGIFREFTKAVGKIADQVEIRTKDIPCDRCNGTREDTGAFVLRGTPCSKCCGLGKVKIDYIKDVPGMRRTCTVRATRDELEAISSFKVEEVLLRKDELTPQKNDVVKIIKADHGQPEDSVGLTGRVLSRRIHTYGMISWTVEYGEGMNAQRWAYVEHEIEVIARPK